MLVLSPIFGHPRPICMNRLLPFAFLLPLTGTAQNYFQQQVDYTITVRLDDEAHMLHAQESFVYTNNSTIALDTLWMHLWPNAYRDRETALCDQLDRMGDLDLHFASEEQRGYIDSLKFTADGALIAWGLHPKHADIGWIKLASPLAPGRSVTIATPFRVKIPDGKFSRLGHTDQAYYITQWYPKPAVFDGDGWHAMPYLTSGEFHSEFGSFDVSITLPSNYVVGATGILQEQSERTWMDSLATVPYSETQRFYLDKQRSRLNAFPPSAPTTKTIRFKQDRIHDFGWFADKRFIVRKSAMALPKSGRPVTTWALFTPKNALLWSDATTYINESVRLYSQWVGDYPYDAATAVDGTISAGGGMEYPMITIIGNMDSKESLDNVIAHEVGHNWFYGILGSNERDHAWMDEGMNSFVELRYMRTRYPNSGFNLDIPGFKKLTEGTTDAHRLQSELGYRFNARRNLDQPLSLTSNDYTTVNYGTMVYMKTAMVMDHLLAYLGEETMDKCMHAYYEEWKFKHPQPEDMRKVFERESGQKLSWVFDGLIATDLKVDIKARALKEDQTFSIRNTGLDSLPVPVTAWHGSDSLGTRWFMSTSATVGSEHSWPTADRIRIDAGNRTIDIDRRNNEVRAHGLFKRWRAPKLESLMGLERNDRSSVYYSLLPAWNGHDGWQVGFALRNTTFPSQRTEWVLAPLYAFGSERLVGGARVEHHFDRIRSRLFQNIHVGLSGRTSGTFHDHDAVAWYEKLSPSVRFDLKRDPLTRPWAHTIGLRGIRIWKASEFTSDDEVVYHYKTSQDYVELQHSMADARKLHPSSIITTLTAAEDWLRGSVEIKQAFAYNTRNKQFRVRAFAGSFLSKGGDFLTNGLDAWGITWGPEDMLYDHAYLERGATKDFTGRQFNKQQGAFKTPFLQGGSDTWIASVGAELDMPFKLPLAFFATAGWVPITKVDQDGKSTSAAGYIEAGVGLPVIKDVLEIWFPLFVSQRIADEEEYLERSVSDRIRFVIALEKLDPTRLLRNLRP